MPCPYGYVNNLQKACGCTPAIITKYQKRISDPMPDHIDIHIEVSRVDYEKLSGDSRIGETSEAIRARVQAACDIQQINKPIYFPCVTPMLPFCK